MRRSSNAGLFWPVLVAVTAADLLTKALAVAHLVPHQIYEVWGNGLRLMLVFNPGAAFGLNVGQFSRQIFVGLTLLALVILGRLYRSTRPGDAWRVLALALVCGGALGNLIDRLRSVTGVIDFIDVGLGDAARWPTFNVADMAVSFGAFLLAWVLWEEDRRANRLGTAVGSAAAATSATVTQPVASESAEL
ncbi:MAG TPA: signal peptidase II [Gemmatimonadaceae bacterium]|nr:signal peptidase II [Gemmatimonadaceae bacterium]